MSKKIKVLFSRVYEVEVDAYDDPHTKAREMVIEGHPDVVVGQLEFDGYDDADEE
jgi:hypothetical protein